MGASVYEIMTAQGSLGSVEYLSYVVLLGTFDANLHQQGVQPRGERPLAPQGTLTTLVPD